MAKITKVIAVLLSPKHVPDVIKLGKAIVTSMTGNAYFPSPTPTLASVTAHLADLEAAEIVANTRAKGAAAARDVKLRGEVDSDLQGLRAHVQLCADADLDHATAIIESAAMNVKKRAVRVKLDLSARLANVSGTVILMAKAAAPRASYEWAYSLDEKTWVSVPISLVAKTTVSGLSPLTTYAFRYRIFTQKGGQGDWHQAITLFVR